MRSFFSHILLNIAYLAVITLALPWLIYQAFRYGKYRDGYCEKFLGLVPRRASDQPCIWLHAVSVGEVNLLRQIVGQLQKQQPDYDLVISTTTNTGYEIAKARFPDLTVFYCPLDFSWAVHTALRRIRPDLLVLAELELWPNLIHAANRQGVPVAVVNARLSPRSFRGYRRWRWFLGTTFQHLSLVIAQSTTTASRFLQLGVLPQNVQVGGNVKFDGCLTEPDNPQSRRLAQLAKIASDEPVLLAGSTQAPEEQLALETFCRLQKTEPKLRLILAPRHRHRFEEVARLLDSSKIPWQRRTTLELHGADPQARVLLVDTLGELAAWWATATIGFVGGSFGNRGGQNMLEPAGYGVAVCFGPNTRNFRDVVELLLANDAVCVVHNQAELAAFTHKCLAEPSWRTQLGQRARQVVLQHQGATAQTVQLLGKLLTSRRSHPEKHWPEKHWPEKHWPEKHWPEKHQPEEAHSNHPALEDDPGRQPSPRAA